MKIVLLSLSLSVLFFSKGLFASHCSKWSPAIKIGEVDNEKVPEASGIQISRLVNDRLYHINDSGDGPFVYHSDFSGANTKKFSIAGFEPVDVEALGYGKCGNKSCLIVADIGDNKEIRPSYSLQFIEEQLDYSDEVQPQKVVQFKYPDRSHNAESIFITKENDLYIITKEINLDDQVTKPSFIFRIKSENLAESSNHVVAENIGRLDLASVHSHFAHQAPTDISLNPDQSRLLVLNYKDVVEYQVDFDSSVQMKLSNPTIIPIQTLAQQESISYSLDGRSFIYETELRGRPKGEIMKVYCLD